MVFDKSNPRNTTRVARLLGRPTVEFVETNSYSEFYWELPQVLPKMSFCAEYFRQDPELYYDWHLAMDQAESILRDCLGKHFSIKSASKSKSWLRRAVEAEREKWADARKWFHCALCSPMDMDFDLDDEDDIVRKNNVPFY